MDEACAAADPVANASADWVAAMATDAEDYQFVLGVQICSESPHPGITDLNRSQASLQLG